MTRLSQGCSYVKAASVLNVLKTTADEEAFEAADRFAAARIAITQARIDPGAIREHPPNVL